jgi:hypothetical protein
MPRISVDMDACASHGQAGADHVEIEHGDLERFRFVARYVRDGHDVGILGCGMPKQLAAAYRQLSRSLGERAEAGVPSLA